MENKPHVVVNSPLVRPWPRYIEHKYEPVVEGTESEEIYKEIQTFVAFHDKMWKWFYFIEKCVTLSKNEEEVLKMCMYRLPSPHDLLQEYWFPVKSVFYNTHYTQFSNYFDHCCRTNIASALGPVLGMMATWSSRTRSSLNSVEERQQFEKVYDEAKDAANLWIDIARPKIGGYAYSRMREKTGGAQVSVRTVKKKK
jgi:hypothetical protein